MSLKRSLGRKDTKKKPAMEKHVLKDAYIVTAETGDVIRRALGEIPSKYKNVPLIIAVLENSARGTVTIQLPKGQVVPSLSKPPPLPGQAPTEEPEKEAGDE